MRTAVYKSRPAVAAALPNPRLDAGGREIVDPKPHPLLLAGPRIPTLAEQIESLTRLSAIRRKSFLDDLPEDYYGEDLEDDIYSEGLTPHELEGLRDFWGSLPHPTPEPATPVSGEKTPTGGPDTRTPSE